MCGSCNFLMVIIQRIIVSAKYQLYEGEEDQKKSELIIEV